MNTTVSLALIALGFFVAGVVLYGIISRNKNASKSAGEEKADSVMLQNQLAEMKQTLDDRLGQSQKEMSEAMRSQFGESAKIVREVTSHLEKLNETNRQVVGFADQLKSLQDILKNPKQRGGLGEYYLETVIGNTLPPKHFEMQHRFSDGEIVDAIVFLKDGKKLPIDSKFSLENYNKWLEASDQAQKDKLEKDFKQDVRKRIDETAKYIRPEESTMDFAFMFIPSEAIYYDLLINHVGGRDLLEYAFQEKKVIIVSPTSFMAYLQTVLQGLRSLQIEESAKEIRKYVEKLGRHIEAHEGSMQKLGKTLDTSVNHFNTAHKELEKMDKDVYKITDQSAGVDPLKIEKTARDDD